MDCLIKQPAGVGDIFFCQKIACKLHEKYNCNIIWPVIPEFYFLKDYLKDYSFVTYYDASKDFPYKQYYNNTEIIVEDNFLFLPLCFADKVFGDCSVMNAKYKYVNLNYHDWVDYFNFTRNVENEKFLYYDILGLHDGEEYILVNRNFASPPNMQRCNKIPQLFNKKTIEIRLIGGISIFDWCKVITQASELHFVETSFNYMIEKMILPEDTKLFMYSKWNPPNFNQVRHLFKKEWNYVQ